MIGADHFGQCESASCAVVLTAASGSLLRCWALGRSAAARRRWPSFAPLLRARRDLNDEDVDHRPEQIRAADGRSPQTGPTSGGRWNAGPARMNALAVEGRANLGLAAEVVGAGRLQYGEGHVLFVALTTCGAAAVSSAKEPVPIRSRPRNWTSLPESADRAPTVTS
jgi:hypothetical protein